MTQGSGGSCVSHSQRGKCQTPQQGDVEGQGEFVEHCEGVKVPPQELSHKIGDHLDSLCGDPYEGCRLNRPLYPITDIPSASWAVAEACFPLPFGGKGPMSLFLYRSVNPGVP